MLRFDNHRVVDCVGRSGGVALLWKNNVKLCVTNHDRNFIDVEIMNANMTKWRLTGFYGFPERARRRESWNLLKWLANKSDLPWVVIEKERYGWGGCSETYDRVDWGFLMHQMKQLGFAEKWIAWMQLCVTTVAYSVNLNGNQVGPINPSRGLCQSDPLSPYLFLFCVEDDSFLFSSAKLEEVMEVKAILQKYELQSGQAINLQKLAKEVLKQGYRWVVGDGRSINVSNDAWLRGKHGNRVDDQYLTTVSGLKVSNLFISGTKDWDVIKVHSLFSSSDARCILEMPIPKNQFPDRIVWCHSSVGKYIVKSGYKFWKQQFSQCRRLEDKSGLNWKSVLILKSELKISELKLSELKISEDIYQEIISGLKKTFR
ncbi:hypothetical protein AgCh_029753 [Apium graveolens]